MDDNLPSINSGELLHVFDFTGTGQNTTTGNGSDYWIFNGAQSIYYQPMERTNSGENGSRGFRTLTGSQSSQAVDSRSSRSLDSNSTKFAETGGELLDAAIAMLMLQPELT